MTDLAEDRKKFEQLAREFIVANQPEPLKCMYCGLAQSTGPMASGAIWLDQCAASPTKNHTYEIMVMSADAGIQAEVERLTKFALSVAAYQAGLKEAGRASILSLLQEATYLALTHIGHPKDSTCPKDHCYRCKAEARLEEIQRIATGDALVAQTPPPKHAQPKCENCSVHVKWGGFDGRELGQNMPLPCGCLYCWHCADNRGRDEDHDPNCKGPVASAAVPPCSHRNMSGHEWSSWCDDCGETWQHRTPEYTTTKSVASGVEQASPPQPESDAKI